MVEHFGGFVGLERGVLHGLIEGGLVARAFGDVGIIQFDVDVRARETARLYVASQESGFLARVSSQRVSESVNNPARLQLVPARTTASNPASTAARPWAGARVGGSLGLTGGEIIAGFGK